MGRGDVRGSGVHAIKRKLQISDRAMKRTLKKLGIHRGYKWEHPKVKVVLERDYAKGHDPDNAAAWYKEWVDGGTMYLRKTYFHGRDAQKTITHEYFHHISGPHEYEKRGDKLGVSAQLEEGFVEYLSQASQYYGHVGRGTIYSGGHHSYGKQVQSAAMLMEILGRKRMLRNWIEGFDHNIKQWTTDLKRKGFKKTAKHIEDYYGAEYLAGSPTSPVPEYTQISQAIRDDVKTRNKPLVLGIFPYEDQDEWERKQKIIQEHEEKLRRSY